MEDEEKEDLAEELVDDESDNNKFWFSDALTASFLPLNSPKELFEFLINFSLFLYLAASFSDL